VSEPVRGHVYWADLGQGELPFLCVSNDARNARLGSWLAVRITTSPKPDLASVVQLGPADPLVGTVLCDDLLTLYPDEIGRDGGPVSLTTMRSVSAGLKAALGV
jgi:mRNA interferase MazF